MSTWRVDAYESGRRVAELPFGEVMEAEASAEALAARYGQAVLVELADDGSEAARPTFTRVIRLTQATPYVIQSPAVAARVEVPAPPEQFRVAGVDGQVWLATADEVAFSLASFLSAGFTVDATGKIVRP